MPLLEHVFQNLPILIAAGDAVAVAVGDAAAVEGTTPPLATFALADTMALAAADIATARVSLAVADTPRTAITDARWETRKFRVADSDIFWPSTSREFTSLPARTFWDRSPTNTVNTTTVASFGANTTVRWIQFQPLASNNTAATPGAATGQGWHIPVGTIMSEAIMNDPMGRRYIPPGRWGFQVVLSFNDDTGAPADTYKVQARVFRRVGTTTPTYSFLFSTETTLVSSTVVGTKTYNWVAADQPQYEFVRDETLHVEYWMQGRGGLATGIGTQNITLRLEGTS